MYNLAELLVDTSNLLVIGLEMEFWFRPPVCRSTAASNAFVGGNAWQWSALHHLTINGGLAPTELTLLAC